MRFRDGEGEHNFMPAAQPANGHEFDDVWKERVRRPAGIYGGELSYKQGRVRVWTRRSKHRADGEQLGERGFS
jgi:hypothetical protein